MSYFTFFQYCHNYHKTSHWLCSLLFLQSPFHRPLRLSPWVQVSPFIHVATYVPWVRVGPSIIIATTCLIWVRADRTALPSQHFGATCIWNLLHVYTYIFHWPSNYQSKANICHVTTPHRHVCCTPRRRLHTTFVATETIISTCIRYTIRYMYLHVVSASICVYDCMTVVFPHMQH